LVGQALSPARFAAVSHKILILGYGNPLRGDDGFGCQTALMLRTAIHRPDVEIRELHQLTPELAEPVSQATRVIFLDAGRDGAPGTLRRERVEPAVSGSFTHHLTPSALLACARELYGRAPEGTLITAAGAAFDYTTSLSPSAEAAVGEAVQQVLSLLQEL
jgi:hydrogenase maturation protease